MTGRVYFVDRLSVLVTVEYGAAVVVLRVFFRFRWVVSIETVVEYVLVLTVSRSKTLVDCLGVEED